MEAPEVGSTWRCTKRVEVNKNEGNPHPDKKAIAAFWAASDLCKLQAWADDGALSAEAKAALSGTSCDRLLESRGNHLPMCSADSGIVWHSLEPPNVTNAPVGFSVLVPP